MLSGKKFYDDTLELQTKRRDTRKNGGLSFFEEGTFETKANLMRKQ
jgi:hypothetical protein